MCFEGERKVVGKGTRQLLPGIVIPGAQAAAHLSLELEGCEVMGGVRWSGLRAALGS